MPLGDDGNITIRNAVGSVHAIVDVLGWIPTGPATTRSTRPVCGGHPPRRPAGRRRRWSRWMPTRCPVPAGGVEALVFNLTALNATTGTWLTVYPAARGAHRLQRQPRVGAVSANLRDRQGQCRREVAIRNANGSGGCAGGRGRLAAQRRAGHRGHGHGHGGRRRHRARRAGQRHRRRRSPAADRDGGSAGQRHGGDHGWRHRRHVQADADYCSNSAGWLAGHVHLPPVWRGVPPRSRSRWTVRTTRRSP